MARRLLSAHVDDATPSHGSYPGEMRPPPPLSGIGRTPFDERDVANELRRGWTPIDPGSPHVPADAVLALRRERTPATGDALVVAHRGHAFCAPNVEGVRILYLLESAGDITPLPGAAWADWDAHGRLLAAEATGAIAIPRESSRVGRGVGAGSERSHPGSEPGTGVASHW